MGYIQRFIFHIIQPEICCDDERLHFTVPAVNHVIDLLQGKL